MKKTISLFHCLWIIWHFHLTLNLNVSAKTTRTIAYMKYIYFHSAFFYFFFLLLLLLLLLLFLLHTKKKKQKYFCLESSVFSYLCFNTVVWCCGVSHRNRVDYIQYSVFEFNFFYDYLFVLCVVTTITIIWN